MNDLKYKRMNLKPTLKMQAIVFNILYVYLLNLIN